MRGLVPYAWRSLVARPARSLLTAFGIALGVAVLVAALAVNAGLETAIERTVTSAVGRADLRVAAFTESGLSGATVTALDGVPGIAVAAPAIERRAFLGTEPGRPTETEPVTVLGVDPTREPRVHDLALVRGSALADVDEASALVTERLAAAEGLDLGSQVSILGAGAPVSVRVIGILAGDGPAVGSAGRTLVLPIRTAQRLALADGEAPPATGMLAGVTRIDAVLAVGADPGTVTSEIATALTAEPYVLSTPRDIAASMRASTADIRGTIALLASITLFAAAFLIFNTLAMTVVERIRELALLRAAGATRGQVVRVVAAQAVLLGLGGSVAGLLLGALLALVLTAWLHAAGNAGLERPELTPAIMAAGLLAGMLVTLVAALEPARRAGSVSPVTALRARSDPGAAARAHVRWLVLVMVVVAIAGILLLPVGEGAPGGKARALAVYGALLLAVLLTPALLVPLGRIAGLPFSLVLRLEERLARAAIARDRGRSTLTVGALVIGLAMVVALGCVQANARVVATGWLTDVVPGDAVLTAIAPAPVGDGGVDEQLRHVPGVALATPLASFDLAFEGAKLEATAVRGADIAADGRLTFTAGDRGTALAALDAGGSVILPRSRAERIGVGVGDVIAVMTTDGLVDLKVVGLVERSFPGRTGETALVGWRDAEAHFGIRGADAFAVRYAPGDRAAAAAAVVEVARAWALRIAPIEAVAGTMTDALDRVFGLLDLLTVAALVIAAFGIVNTLSMDTWERTRELGMLRAAGMSRRQVWRSVLVEAGILGAIGALIGTVAGIGIGALLVTSSSGRAVSGLQVPWPTIALTIVLAMALAMLAAAQPARIAGQRSIVSAVRGE
jgi:putative ABC transport system permease protein